MFYTYRKGKGEKKQVEFNQVNEDIEKENLKTTEKKEVKVEKKHRDLKRIWKEKEKFLKLQNTNKNFVTEKFNNLNYDQS